MESGLYLFDNQLKLKRTIQPKKLIENSQEMELNGVITARASMKYEKDIETYSYFGQKERNNFWLYKIKNIHKEDNKIELSGIHIFYDDLKGCIIRDIRPKNQTAINAFNQILQGTGWVISLSTAQKTTNANFYYKSVLTAFNEALKIWNCEFIPKINFVSGVITSKSIELHDRISKDYGKWFEYGDKLVSIVAETDADIYTAYIGLGKGEQTENGGFGRKLKFDSIAWSVHGGKPADKPLGQDYIEIKEATKKWGYPDGRPKIGIVEFSEIEDKEELIQSTYKYALENCRPKVQLKSKTINFEKVELGEICTVIRSNMNIRYKTRIFKIKKDFLNPGLIDFEFGDKVSISVSDRVKDEKEKELKKDLEVRSKFEKVLDEITKSYFNDDGYNYELKSGNKYNLPAGYYSFDKPIDENPTKVVYMGAGKVLIANEKKPNGEWNWKTAMTSEGIVGGEIVSNSITANKLAADVGQSLDLSSNVSINSLVENNVNKKLKNINIDNVDVSDRLYNLLNYGNFSEQGSWSIFQQGEQQSTHEFIENKFKLNINSNQLNFILYQKIYEKKGKFTVGFDFARVVGDILPGKLTVSISAYKDGKSVKAIYHNIESIGRIYKEFDLSNIDFEYFQLQFGFKTISIIAEISNVVLLKDDRKSKIWIPSLEDLTRDITKIANENSKQITRINQTVGDIELETSKKVDTKYFDAELQKLLTLAEENSTKLNQNSERILIQAKKVVELHEKLTEKVNREEMETWFEFSVSGLKIGRKGSNIKLNITNEKLSYVVGDKENSYWTNEAFYILTTMKIGEFSIITEEDGSLSIV